MAALRHFLNHEKINQFFTRNMAFYSSQLFYAGIIFIAPLCSFNPLH